MTTSVTATFLLLPLLLLSLGMAATQISCKPDHEEAIQLTLAGLLQARNWVVDQASMGIHGSAHSNYSSDDNIGLALNDCGKLYEDSEARLAQLVSGGGDDDDALTWLSGAAASHRTCLDGLEEKGFVGAYQFGAAQNLSVVLSDALDLYGKNSNGKGKGKGKVVRKGVPRRRPSPKSDQDGGLLASWNPANSKADFVVAKDGSGTHTSINDALSALARMGQNCFERPIVYVKSGVYSEKVEIERWMQNVMFVGDGIDRTIITSDRNVPDGSTTYSSATFGVSGDGFWARDMTFENIAGPQKHQAVALRVNSDLSVFYRCSFKGYQDTHFVHSLRQFYRDCHIYGTVDFIFGDAPVVFQNCDIFVRRPMDHQSNMITAQGRDNPNENTGISIQASRIIPASEFTAVKGMFKTYLGRPWKQYSRTVVSKTDLDGLIHPEGWTKWNGDFALSTLFYGEYMNLGNGASTDNRVKWPGFHVLSRPEEVSPFAVSIFIQGDSWIPATGVPFWPGI